MARSMTAFARQQSQQHWGSLVWELKSVNHRYLEPHLRIPESLRELEPALRDQLRLKTSRGKIDCTLHLYPQKKQLAIQLNTDLARQLIAAAEQIASLTTNPQPIDTLEVLRWPGVMQDTELDMSDIKQQALTLFNSALDDLSAGRDREGQVLVKLIEQRLDAMSNELDKIRTKMPLILEHHRTLLLTRISDLALQVEPSRIEQEIALLAQKADVTEEIDRLDTHIQEVRRILTQEGAIGRRLDFLMQELNREANTLSSKAIVVETTQCAIELKVLIEQMREQIQNIE